MRNIVIILLLISSSVGSTAQSCYPVIPYPNELQEADGFFEFKSKLSITLPEEFESEMDMMRSVFSEAYYTELLPSTNGKLVFNKNILLDKEAYELSVSEAQIIVGASTTTGCFRAFQTIRQLMHLTGRGSYRIPACRIKDKPAYPWRAFMLDEARNFKGKDAVKVLLDQMAYLKMNVFHWYLTDDQGWRIEIKKYPLLTETGAWRDSTHVTTDETGWSGTDYDPHPHGGYYTQDQIKEIVDYAAKRRKSEVSIEVGTSMSKKA